MKHTLSISYINGFHLDSPIEAQFQKEFIQYKDLVFASESNTYVSTPLPFWVECHVWLYLICFSDLDKLYTSIFRGDNFSRLQTLRFTPRSAG